jgi:hypothetical protein
MSAALRKLVRAGASDEQPEAQAVEEATVPLNAQSLALARTGAISLGEAFHARLD